MAEETSAANGGMNEDDEKSDSSDDDMDESPTSNEAASTDQTFGINASHDFTKFTSCMHNVACETITHATAQFRGLLDHVCFSEGDFCHRESTEWADATLRNKDVDTMGGLPSDFYGSDHVLVFADLQRKQNK